MFKKFKLIKLIFTIPIIFIVTASPTNAQSDDTYTYDLVPYIQVGSYANVDEEVNSDVILISPTARVNRNINGDLFVIADSLIINSEVTGNIRAIATDITINAPVRGSVSVISESLQITPLAEIENDVYGLIAKLVHNGRIGGSLNISPSPDSTAELNGKVMGNLYYTGKRPLINEGSFIGGNLINIPALEQNADNRKDLVLGMLFYAGSLAFLYVIYRLFSKRHDKIQNALNDRDIPKLLLRGLLFFFIIPLVMLLFIITVIGIPAAIILGLLYALIIYVSPIIGALYLNKKLFPSKVDHFITILLALAVLIILFQTPIIGFFIRTLTIILTMGIVSRVINFRRINE